MVGVTVKAFAELIHTPLYGQLRILNEQKYPRQAPGFFKMQYYRPALEAIRRYYGSGNSEGALPTNANQIVAARQHQRDNNHRAIMSFRNGTQKHRKLTPLKVRTWETTLANIRVRCTPDISFAQGSSEGVLLFDFRQQQPELEIIRTTLELVHHTLNQNGVQIPMRQIEYVHIDSDSLHRYRSPRQTTLTRANQTAAAIQTLWNSL